jgi:poly(A) polymerase
LLKATTETRVLGQTTKWIRTDRPFNFPTSVRQALQILDDAGHIAYIVGGSVRDFLLGPEWTKKTKDHDIATSASPDDLVRLFPNAVTVGKAFGVIKVPVEDSRSPFLEIATFRKDLEYKDHRHPTGILFAGPTEDARRRDFSINGLFYDPKTARILDVVDGIDDLRKKVIRAIGNPMERFKEDALRLLRAVRFSTYLGFDLDPATADAIRARARLISKVSGERVRDELTLMWTGPRPMKALKMLSDLGLLVHILPELDKLKGLENFQNSPGDGDVWSHTLKVVDVLAKQNEARMPQLAWAALLQDIGKPIAARRSSKKNFNAHELDGAKIAKDIGERLKMAKSDIDVIAWMVEEHLKFREVFQMRESTLQRFIRQPGFDQLLKLYRAEATATDGNLAFYEFCASRYDEYQKRAKLEGEAKLISGEDLIQLGLSPGPKFSEILRTIEDLALEKKLHSKEEALEFVVKNFVG